ncbi:leucyl aminopeptidase family protein [Aliidiomarina halalkaliphila]|uniref:Leucyl aminopeptidase family protein n=1 Tax=Aliidiomarina halalkaliphila TaxID=2593535 RepID=A0A552X3Y9_9GAMM|nr:leucyl aminopeptidase family protein [Aliidiomarina halalkaliphila]TRW49323.1 leucyl aminopeptidase family protein [Aliidiomarina halalkaliphila]
MATPQVQVVATIDELGQHDFDALILVGPEFGNLNDAIDAAIAQGIRVNAGLLASGGVLACVDVPAERLILAPTGPLDRDYDDVRRFYDAARKAADVAVAAGATRPAIMTVHVPNDEQFNQVVAATYFGFAQGLYQPLEAREHFGEELEVVSHVGIIGKADAAWLEAVESGRRVARDLCGTEPERMSPLRFAEYCQDAFAGTSVKVSVVDDQPELEVEYPLLAAVARASFATNQRPCVIRLEYVPEGPIEQTLMLVGKGITYDTGGADLKVGGHMAGMSRDKGGAAGVAGFVKAVAGIQPKGIKVVAELAAVRNNIGETAFVADEIITGRSGKRVRIGNTDAEGRLIMADCLARMVELAPSEKHPMLFTVATLTGHAALAKGPYTALVPNKTAARSGQVDALLTAGELWADPAELSMSRREDFDFVRGRTKADDLLSSNNGPSATTKRGHQFPMAFLVEVSGLGEHQLSSAAPIPYVHVDIAGSGVEGGDWQHGKPTATPVLALAGHYLR